MEQVEVNVAITGISLRLMPVHDRSLPEGVSPYEPVVSITYAVQYKRPNGEVTQITKVEQLRPGDLPLGAEGSLRHLDAAAIEHISKAEIVSVLGVFNDA